MSDFHQNGIVTDFHNLTRRPVAELEADLVRSAQERTAGNQTRAAELLGLSRFGLQKMMKRLEIGGARDKKSVDA